MKQPTFCGRELLSLSVIEAARAGDPLAVERVLRTHGLQYGFSYCGNGNIAADPVGFSWAEKSR